MLSHGSREEFVRLESILSGLADTPAARAWRELWRPA